MKNLKLLKLELAFHVLNQLYILTPVSVENNSLQMTNKTIYVQSKQ